MENQPRSSDIFNQQQPVNYGSLKVLTVLTFIGCGLSYISLCYSATRWGSYEQDLAQAQEMQDKVGGGGGFLSNIFQGSIEMMQKGHEYRYILFGTGLLFATFCLVGAIQMRNLKKSGYPLYVFGELAPLIVSVILLGTSAAALMSIGFAALFAIIFVILYTTQRKYLIR